MSKRKALAEDTAYGEDQEYVESDIEDEDDIEKDVLIKVNRDNCRKRII